MIYIPDKVRNKFLVKEIIALVNKFYETIEVEYYNDYCLIVSEKNFIVFYGNPVKIKTGQRTIKTEEIYEIRNWIESIQTN